MNRFSETSKRELATALPILQKAASIVLKIKDHSVIQGHRGEDEQNAAFYGGFSKAKWPNGRHNRYPSHAIDVRAWPWPEDEQQQREEQYYLMGLYRGVLAMLGWYARTGADWDNDGEISDNRKNGGFDDLFHVEVYGEED